MGTTRQSRRAGEAANRNRRERAAGRHGMRLPPGQRPVEGFPRFGTHLHRPAPAVPDSHALEIDGAVAEPFTLPITELAQLPRRELTADFHCVAGWSAVNLRWEGVPFDSFYRRVIEPALSHTAVTHITFTGLDGHKAVVAIEDARGEDVLIAENLDGLPLDSDHGAPVRLVSPSQYGYISIKHLSRIELHTSEPVVADPPLADRLIESHPRARVWHEERHGSLPGWTVRALYRALIPPIRFLSRRGSKDTAASE